ncbi:MAG: hypothetical protein ACI3Y0_01385 [Prevotella sp.]
MAILSSASSGISGVVADAKRLIPEGNFLEPNLWIRSSHFSNRHRMIEQWLKDIDYTGITSSISAVGRDGEEEAIATYKIGGQRIKTDLSKAGISIKQYKKAGKTYSKKHLRR